MVSNKPIQNPMTGVSATLVKTILLSLRIFGQQAVSHLSSISRVMVLDWSVAKRMSPEIMVH
jgi:hypothetical protein